LVAAIRADEFLDKGDVNGSAVWRRVLKAIKEIGRDEPREGEAVNWDRRPICRPAAVRSTSTGWAIPRPDRANGADERPLLRNC